MTAPETPDAPDAPGGTDRDPSVAPDAPGGTDRDPSVAPDAPGGTDRDPPDAPHASDAPGGTDQDAPDPGLLVRITARVLRPYAGWGFIAAGALLVLLGYLGVSREALVAKQIPYLVSGGIGGVLLCVVGAYFLGTEELRRDSGRLDRLERQVGELHAVLLDRPDAPDAPAAGGDQAATNGAVPTGTVTGGQLVAVEGGETFHRAGCALAAGKDQRPLDERLARGRGLRPCPVCEPVGV